MQYYTYNFRVFTPFKPGRVSCRNEADEHKGGVSLTPSGHEGRAEVAQEEESKETKRPNSYDETPNVWGRTGEEVLRVPLHLLRELSALA